MILSLSLSLSPSRSLLNFAISKEVGAPLKSALNALLTSLCRLHPPWFHDAIEVANQLIQELSSEERGRVLHSLAQCSLSNECITLLLESPFICHVIDDLNKSLTTLASSADTPTDHLLSVCSNLAFLTDIAFGHKVAQQWLILKEHAKFWPLLLQIFSEPPSNFVENELAFCQHTIQQFFAVCIKFSIPGKELFVTALLNALREEYSLEAIPIDDRPFSLKLTPFLRTLIIDHLLGPEAVHVVLEIDHTFLETAKGKLRIDSITPTYESPHYHPSYPVNGSCYYLKLSSEYTLTRILMLLLDEPQKTRDAKPHNQSRLRKPQDSAGSKPVPEPTRKGPEINIFNFDIRMVNYSERPGQASSWVAFQCMENRDVVLSLTTKIREVIPSKLYGCAHTRALRVCKATGTNMSESEVQPASSVSLLEVFIKMKGLELLADLFPYVHAGLWPQDSAYVSTSLAKDVDCSLLPPYAPAFFLPPHSYVLFGLGLRLKEYGVILGESGIRNNSWYILRGALGATEEGKSLMDVTVLTLSLSLFPVEKQISSSLSELFSFLPFLYLFQMIREAPSTHEKGRQLRHNIYSVGIIHHLLKCLSLASHHPPRQIKEAAAVEPAPPVGNQPIRLVNIPALLSNASIDLYNIMSIYWYVLVCIGMCT